MNHPGGMTGAKASGEMAGAMMLAAALSLMHRPVTDEEGRKTMRVSREGMSVLKRECVDARYNRCPTLLLADTNPFTVSIQPLAHSNQLSCLLAHAGRPSSPHDQ